MIKDGRTTLRAGFDQGTRLSLLETDADEFEILTARMETKLDKLASRITTFIIAICTLVIASFLNAAIMVAL